MVVEHLVQGYDKFIEFIKNFKSDGRIFILYTGSNLPDGNSWCPDCVQAKPHIKKGFGSAPQNTQFITVEVGDRAFWKDPQCPFRTNPKTSVKVLPTIVEWGTQRRLEGDQCESVELIEMLLEGED